MESPIETLKSIPPRGSTSVDWGWVGSALIGLIATSWFSGIADLIRTGFTALVIRPIEYTTQLSTAKLDLILRTSGSILSGAFTGAFEFVRSFGILGFLIGLVLAVGAAYLWAEVLTRGL